MECSELIPTPDWLDHLLKDPQITDVCINGEESILIEKAGTAEAVSLSLVHREWLRNSLKRWVLAQLSQVGKTWDAKFPFVDASLLTGHRLHVAFPPITRFCLAVSLRRIPSFKAGKAGKAGQLRDAPPLPSWQKSPRLSLIENAVVQGESVLIAGATGSGKTTLAAHLLSKVSPLERIIALEDTAELLPDHPQFLSLLTRPPNSDGYGEVGLRTLLKQTLRMRPDRIVLGECRGDEVLELLQALNTGHGGALATLHANSARDALKRIELLCLLACDGRLPPGVLREFIAAGLQWVCLVQKRNSSREITELCRVEGIENGVILMRSV